MELAPFLKENVPFSVTLRFRTPLEEIRLAESSTMKVEDSLMFKYMLQAVPCDPSRTNVVPESFMSNMDVPDVSTFEFEEYWYGLK